MRQDKKKEKSLGRIFSEETRKKIIKAKSFALDIIKQIIELRSNKNKIINQKLLQY